jgi:hypothetical protein
VAASEEVGEIGGGEAKLVAEAKHRLAEGPASVRGGNAKVLSTPPFRQS